LENLKNIYSLFPKTHWIFSFANKLMNYLTWSINWVKEFINSMNKSWRRLCILWSPSANQVWFDNVLKLLLIWSVCYRTQFDCCLWILPFSFSLFCFSFFLKKTKFKGDTIATSSCGPIASCPWHHEPLFVCYWGRTSS